MVGNELLLFFSMRNEVIIPVCLIPLQLYCTKYTQTLLEENSVATL